MSKKRTTAARKKNCKHTGAVHTWRDGHAGPIASRCSTVFGCGAWLPLGPSSDDSEAVRVEMRAAELVAMRALEPGRFARESSADEALGFEAASERCAPRLGEESGWLAFEIETYDQREQRDTDAWPWDSTRPVAGQYEEHLVRAAVTLAPVPDPNALAAVAIVEIDRLAAVVGHTIAALADGIVEAGGTLPYPGDVACASASPTEPVARDDYDDLMAHLDALDDVELVRVENDIGRMENAAAYEAQRAAEPDPRDEDGPDVERLMAEAPRRVPTLDETLDRQSGVMRGLAEIERKERAIAESVDLGDPTLIEVDGPLPSPECMDAIELLSPGYPCRVTRLADGRVSIEPDDSVDEERNDG